MIFKSWFRIEIVTSLDDQSTGRGERRALGQNSWFPTRFLLLEFFKHVIFVFSISVHCTISVCLSRKLKALLEVELHARMYFSS